MAELSDLQNDPVLIVEQDGPVCTLSINRPSHGNAITMAVRRALIRALDQIGADDTVRVVILRGAGDEAFSVGLDLPELASLTAPEMRAMHELSAALYKRLTTIEKPVIAAIRGGCVGAGLEIALHCDIRLARADARFGLPGVNVGIVSNGAALGRLCKVIGFGSAYAMAMTGGIITAERAFALGLITNVLKVKDFPAAVDELAEHFAQLSPTALTETKRTLQAQADKGTDAAFETAAEGFVRCFEKGDASTRLRGFFGGPEPDVQLH